MDVDLWSKITVCISAFANCNASITLFVSLTQNCFTKSRVVNISDEVSYEFYSYCFLYFCYRHHRMNDGRSDDYLYCNTVSSVIGYRVVASSESSKPCVMNYYFDFQTLCDWRFRKYKRGSRNGD